MPLSEFERRELERISLDLEEDDPGLAVLLSQDPVPRFGRTRIGRGLTALLAGLCILVVGLLLKAPLVGVTGFAVMALPRTGPHGTCGGSLQAVPGVPGSWNGTPNERPA